MNTTYDFTKKTMNHRDRIKLLTEHVSFSVTMLSQEEHKLASKCTQGLKNTSRIVQLPTLRNQFGTNTMWTRHQVYYDGRQTTTLDANT